MRLRGFSSGILTVLVLLVIASYILVDKLGGSARNARAEYIGDIQIILSNNRVNVNPELAINGNLEVPVAAHQDSKFVVEFPNEYIIIDGGARLNGLSGTVSSVNGEAGPADGETIGNKMRFALPGGLPAGRLTNIRVSGFYNPSVRGTYSPFRIYFISGETGAIVADSGDLPGPNISDPDVAEARKGKDIFPPTDPKNVNFDVTSDNYIYITWTDPNDADFNQIRVFRGEKNVVVSGVPIATLPRKWNRYLDKSVEVGKTYVYVFHTIDLDGNMNLSTKEYEVEIPAEPEPEQELGLEPEPSLDAPTSQSDQESSVSSAQEQSKLALPPLVPAVPPFADLSSNFWANEYIRDLKSKGIIHGFGDGTFRPQEEVSKAQTLKMAYRAFGIEPDPELPILFSDVDRMMWYASYVADANRRELIRAFDDGTFKPNDAMQRIDAVMIMTKLSDLAKWGPKDGFVDTIEDPYLGYLKREKIVQGYSDGTFRPRTSISRAEISKILSRLICKFEKRSDC